MQLCSCQTWYETNCGMLTVAAPEAFILFSQKVTISRMLIEDDNEPNIILPIHNLKNIKALAYDPVDKHVYWVDGRTKTIKRALDNGTSVSLDSRKRILVNFQDYIVLAVSIV